MPQHLGQLPAVVVAHRRVGASHALQVSDERGESLLLKLVGEDHPRVSHQRGQVGCFTSGRGGDVEDALAVLGRERHARQERRRGLEHVVAGHVLRRRTDRDPAVVHQEANLGPLADGIQVHAAVDQRRGELAAAALQRVRAQRHGPLRLVRLQELHGLRDGERVQEVLNQKRVVAVVRGEVRDEPLDVLSAAAPGLAPGLEVLEHPDYLLDPALDVLKVRGSVRVILRILQFVHVLILDVEHLLRGGDLRLALSSRVLLPRLLLDGQERLLLGLRFGPRRLAGEVLLVGVVAVLVRVAIQVGKLVLVVVVLVAEQLLRMLRGLGFDTVEGVVVLLGILVLGVLLGVILGVVLLHLDVERLVAGQILLAVRVVP